MSIQQWYIDPNNSYPIWGLQTKETPFHIYSKTLLTKTPFTFYSTCKNAKKITLSCHNEKVYKLPFKGSPY
jgi:hypothetical protein